MFEELFSMFLAIIGMICVILLTYYAGKWYVKRMNTIAGGKHIRVIDRLVVSKTSSILIVEVQGVQYMIGVSDSNIQVMKQLDEPVLSQDTGDTVKERSVNAFKSLINRGKDNGWS